MTAPRTPTHPTWTQIRIHAPSVKSLVWDGNALVDWISGGVRWTLQGESVDPRVRYAFSFDTATTLADSGYTVIYKRRGTKGLLLKDGQVIRELDRSFYHAEHYEYPIALFRLRSGRGAIVHCPEDYNRLRIDDLETGAVIASATKAASDFFHSRLAVSPDGRWLASAGWMWHPVNDVALYDLEAALLDGAVLDKNGIDLDVLTENGNAAGFDAQNRLLVTTDRSGWADDDGKASEGSRLVRLAPGIGAAPEHHAIEFDSAFVPVGANHLLLLNGNPRLLSIETGRVVTTWQDIDVKVPSSAIELGDVEFTRLACDPANVRIAIAHGDEITVLSFDIPAEATT